MNANEPRKELTNEELLMAMIGKTIKTVNLTSDVSSQIDCVNLQFTDGTEVELKSETIDYGGDVAIIGYSPIVINSRTVANMPLEKDWKSLEGIVMKPEKKFPFFKIDPQSNFSQPSD